MSRWGGVQGGPSGGGDRGLTQKGAGGMLVLCPCSLQVRSGGPVAAVSGWAASVACVPFPTLRAGLALPSWSCFLLQQLPHVSVHVGRGPSMGAGSDPAGGGSQDKACSE